MHSFGGAKHSWHMPLKIAIFSRWGCSLCFGTIFFGPVSRRFALPRQKGRGSARHDPISTVRRALSRHR